MKLAVMIIAAGLLATPALADTCTAATDAATRAALAAADEKGQRVATVRVTCNGQRETFLIHRTETPRGMSVSVRTVDTLKGGNGTIRTGRKDSFAGSSTAKIIRVGE